MKLISCLISIAVVLFACCALALEPPPECSCSKGVAAQFMSSTIPGEVSSEVYVANCWCPPQICAVTWNTGSKFAGVQLACALSNPPLPTNNCIDFTRLPRQKVSPRIDVGTFSIVDPLDSAPASTFHSVSIGKTTLTNANNQGIYSPDGLNFNPVVRVNLPGVSNRLDITYTTGMGTDPQHSIGFDVTWINNKGVYSTKRIGKDLPQFKMLSDQITDPEGFDTVWFHGVETSIFKLCANRD